MLTRSDKETDIHTNKHTGIYRTNLNPVKVEEKYKIKYINGSCKGKKHPDSGMCVGILDLCGILSCFQDKENLTG